ncbi:nucleotide disphospho-sugar-binding domain-containing protein [Streptomyces sp. NPDC003032]
MRVLLTVSDWRGHYFCMVPLGWALQAAGHDVRVACPPGQTDAISDAGLVPVPVLDGPDMMTMARMNLYVEALFAQRTLPGNPLHPLTAEPIERLDAVDVRSQAPTFFEDAQAAVARSCDGAVEFAKAWQPQLVVHDVMAMEGALAAKVLGIPAVYAAPGLFGTVETVPGLDLTAATPLASFERHGVGPWSRADIAYVVDPSPDDAVPPLGEARRLPVRYVPYNGTGTLPGWVLEPRDRPRVCVLWGNSASGLFGTEVPTLRYAVDAAVEAGAEVVLTASPAQVEALGPLPEEVRVLRDFPLDLLLEVCDVLIHHGSDNCYLNAAAAGVPQVGLALNTDQREFGRRMEPTGACVTLPGFEATREEVGRAVSAVLTGPSYQEAARRLRAENDARPTPADLVGELEKLATRKPAVR